MMKKQVLAEQYRLHKKTLRKIREAIEETEARLEEVEYELEKDLQEDLIDLEMLEYYLDRKLSLKQYRSYLMDQLNDTLYGIQLIRKGYKEGK